MLRRGIEVAARGRNPARDDHEIRRTQSGGGSRQAWPTAIVANSPADTTSATSGENDDLQRRLACKHREVEKYRQQVLDCREKLKLATLALEERDAELRDKTNALAIAQGVNAGLKRLLANHRQETAGVDALADEDKDELLLLRELGFYAIADKHKNLIEVVCLNDVAGSTGLLMEIAVCDLYHACLKQSEPEFNLAQIINFEADATEGLTYIHSIGIMHGDHKLANVLICRSDAPGGFVGKVTDPGLWSGIGEVRAINMGTPGRVPLENVLSEVPAAPAQDVFAAAVDVCYIVLTPVAKNTNDNVWILPVLVTNEENVRALALETEGGDINQHWADVTQRTMTDGTLARVLLQPGYLNQILPPSERLNVCEVLRKALSPNPADRPDMPFFTKFLRGLAKNTTAYVEGLVARLAGVDLPPLIGHPPVEAPVIVPALGLPSAGLVRVGSGHGGGPSGETAMEQVNLAPPPVLALHPDGDANRAGAAVPPAEAADGGNGSAPPSFDPPAEAAEAANPVMPFVEAIAARVPSVERVHLAPPPVGALHEERYDHGAGAAVPPAEAAHGGNISALHAVDLLAEAANPVMPFVEGIAARVPSVERVRLAPPPAGASHMERDDNGAAAALPQAVDAETGSGLAPRGSIPRALDPSLEETEEGVDPLIQPLPFSPAEVMANHMARTLRSLRPPVRKANTPPPVAAGLFPRRTDRGGGGGGGGGCGGGGGSGSGGRVAIRGALRGLLPGKMGVKKQGFFIPGCCPSRTTKCSFWERFW